MKMKHKLHVGFGLLFVVVLFFGALSLFYLRLISKSNVVILKENYASLEYINQMRSVLVEHDLPLASSAIEQFTAALMQEKNNITEKGEAQAVADLSRNFEILSNSSVSIEQQRKGKEDALRSLGLIEKLNLNAIESKSEAANQTIRNATIYLGAAAAITFLVLFSFVFNLAGFFEEPLHEIADGLREITRKNYEVRLDFDRKDEFGEVSEAFNKMASSLDRGGEKQTASHTNEKLCMEAITQQFQDPVIAINEASEIICINSLAADLFGVDRKGIAGQSISRLSGDSARLNTLFSIPDKGVMKLNDSHYQLNVREIIAPLNHLSELGAEIDISTSGKTVGKIYTLKKLS